MAGSGRGDMVSVTPTALRPIRAPSRWLPRPAASAPTRATAKIRSRTHLRLAQRDGAAFWLLATPPERSLCLGRVGRTAGFAMAGKLERHLLGHDLLRREREQRRPVLIGEWNLDHFLAHTADGEGELAIAGAMAAGDKGR